MFRRSIFISLLLILVMSTLVEAQNREKRHRRDWDDFDDIAWLDIDRDAAPFLEFTFGQPKIEIDGFSGKIANSGMLGLKLGYSSRYEFWEDYLLEREDNYLLAEYLSSKIASDDAPPTEFDNNLWIFGLGRREGLGYDLEDFAFIPYTESNLLWGHLKTENTPSAPATTDTLILNNYNYDVNTIGLYNEAFRFGTSNTVGMKLNVADFVDLTGGYQFTSVMPRYMVWKQLGSYAIETAGLALLDSFIEEITDSSPAAGPVMSALLKGAYMYAFYRLKQDKMSWPFESAAPLTYESFNIGLTLTF